MHPHAHCSQLHPHPAQQDFVSFVIVFLLSQSHALGRSLLLTSLPPKPYTLRQIFLAHASLFSVTTGALPSGRLSQQAIQRLVSSHRDFLSFLEKRVESRATAEDILQNAFVRGLESGPELRDEESAVAWFYRVLRNAVIDHYRQRAATSRALDAYARELSPIQPPPEIREAICSCLHSLLDSLKPEYRDALQLIDIEEASLNDLAAQARISEANAAVRIHRARAALRKRVRLACGTCVEHGCLDCTCGGPQPCSMQTT